MRSGNPRSSPPGSRSGTAGSRAGRIELSAPRRELTPTDEPCSACNEQWQSPRTALPHARLIIISSTPVVEAFGGGTETRYICLECGHTILHSTGRFGKGWH